MRPLPRPSAVVWDMDGTLIDQTAPIIRCYAEVISDLGYPEPDSEQIRRSMGGPMASTMALFVKPEEVHEAGLRFRKRFPEIMYDGLIILPGAKELISWFSTRSVEQVILTNKHGDTARAISRHCGFADFVKSCIGNSDTQWQKPQPELTDYALSTISAQRAGTILIGDSPTDVETALNAGIECIGISTGAHSQAELLSAGAKQAHRSLEEMLGALI